MPISGSILIGLSGMEAYSSGLQTISNNVANLNTLGYKAQTVTFSDVVNSGGGGLSYKPTETTNDGVRVGTPQADFSQGTLSQTGKPLDLAMQGQGFMVLQSNGQTFYARTGSFSVDQQGYITLQGQSAGASYHLTVLDTANQPVAANVNGFTTSPPAATTKVVLGQNLSATATTDTVSNVTVYDSLGTAHTWTLTITPVAASGSSGSSSGKSWTVAVADESGASVGTGTVTFSGSTPTAATAKITINSTPTDGAAALAVVLDFSAVTSFDAGATSSLQTTSVDGNAVGSLNSVTVNSSGNVLLTYSNSLTKSLGPVAVADFRNDQDLTSIGHGLYQNTKSAVSQLLASGVGTAGSVVSGQLETSNVNLTQEFGELILIQRGFQASSQVVSVSNDMIQQLFGIRGQGA